MFGETKGLEEKDLGRARQNLYDRRFGFEIKKPLSLKTANLGMNSRVRGIKLRYKFTFKYPVGGPTFHRDSRPFQARVKEWLIAKRRESYYWNTSRPSGSPEY